MSRFFFFGAAGPTTNQTPKKNQRIREREREKCEEEEKEGKGLGKGGAKRHRKVNELTQQCKYVIHIIPHPLPNN